MKRFLRRPTLHFIFIGLLLFIADRKFNAELPLLLIEQSKLDASRELWQQQLGSGLDHTGMRRLLNQEIDDEILFREGLRRGLNFSPVVQRRLLQLGQFLQLENTDLSEDELIARVRAMGLEQSDVMVRRYLVMTAEQMLSAELDIPEPTAAQIEAWYQTHLGEYVESGRRALSHVYIGGLDAAARSRAEALAKKLQADNPPLEEAIRRGDVFYGGHHLPLKTRVQLDNTLGSRFSDQVWDQPKGQWIGPVESAYGWHVVWISELIPERQKTLEEVSDIIGRSLKEQAVKAALGTKLQAMRKNYVLEVPAAYQQFLTNDAAHNEAVKP